MFLSKKQQRIQETDIFITPKDIDKKLIVRSANECFTDTYFTICPLDRMEKTFWLKITRWDLYTRVNMYHCVKYVDMDKDEYEYIIKAMIEIIRTSIFVWIKEHPNFTLSDFLIW